VFWVISVYFNIRNTLPYLAHSSWDTLYRGVSGKHTLNEILDRNGEMSLELALGNNLTVVSTQCQQKKIHKGNWLAPDQMTLNQIDHVQITSKKKELTEYVRTMRGPNVDPDHYLLKIIVNQELLTIYYKKNRDCTGRWDKSKLKRLIHTYHALPCSNSAVSFVKFFVVAGNNNIY
jgi:hypothetical protein